MPSKMSPIRITVTGAAGQIGYSLLFNLASGAVFGPEQPVILQLLDITPAMGALKGVVMELQDCALGPLVDTIATDDPKVAFKDADYAILVGAMPRKEGMVRKDLLKANVGIFKVQGEAINEVAKKTVKILVVGNPANTNALICKHYAPSIPAENFTALTRLDENRAKSQIALKLGIPVQQVKNVCIWGNHSNTQFPDVAHGFVVKDGAKLSVSDAIKNEEYLRGEYIQTVALRGAAIINARKLSSAMSAAKAACDHIHDWHFGTKEGEFVSMAVASDGSYGTPKGLIYSFPVQINSSGKYTIVQGLPISSFAQEKLNVTTKELSEEREEALLHLAAKV